MSALRAAVALYAAHHGVKPATAQAQVAKGRARNEAAVHASATPPARQPLSPRQRELYYILQRYERAERTWTYVGLCTELGVKSTQQAFAMLQILVEKGWVTLGARMVIVKGFCTLPE